MLRKFGKTFHNDDHTDIHDNEDDNDEDDLTHWYEDDDD